MLRQIAAHTKEEDAGTSDLRDVLHRNGFGSHLVEQLLVRGIPASYLYEPGLIGFEKGSVLSAQLEWLHTRWQDFFLRLVEKPESFSELFSTDLVLTLGQEQTKLTLDQHAQLVQVIEDGFARFLAMKEVPVLQLEALFEIGDGRFYRYLAQRIGPTLTEKDSGSFIVPDLDGPELVARLQAENNLEKVDPFYKQCDIWRGRDGASISGGGRRVGFAILAVPQPVLKSGPLAVMRDAFAKRDLRGHVAAFLQSNRIFGPQTGNFCSFPEDNQLIQLPTRPNHWMYLPEATFTRSEYSLGFRRSTEYWPEDTMLIGFHELETDD